MRSRGVVTGEPGGIDNSFAHGMLVQLLMRGGAWEDAEMLLRRGLHMLDSSAQVLGNALQEGTDWYSLVQYMRP